MRIHDVPDSSVPQESHSNLYPGRGDVSQLRIHDVSDSNVPRLQLHSGLYLGRGDVSQVRSLEVSDSNVRQEAHSSWYPGHMILACAAFWFFGFVFGAVAFILIGDYYYILRES